MAFVLCQHCPETEDSRDVNPSRCRVCRGSGVQDAAEVAADDAHYAVLSIEYDVEQRKLFAELPF